ncbi:MAG: PatB family C-S lyase, partial [Prevotella sp.]|nr:PatB family C-S lyase [Prevotella sp.]
KKRVEHGVFGYATVQNSYYEAVIRWFERRHNWTIQREWIQYTTGVVPAVSAVIKALTMPGERVLILTPVYNCFFSNIRNNGCEVVESKLIVVSSPITSHSTLHTPHSSLHTYEIDWPDFERKCADEKTTVFLLCNPHNPAGRVWTREELQRMNDICLRHGVRIVSDEIHCELVMPGHRFTPFGTVNTATDATAPVICGSPSKSFNIAGLQMAHIICADAETRRRIDRAININEICDVNPFAPLAVEAAYNEGEAWLDALNEYLWGNYQALCAFFAENLPQLKVFQLEGTYLAWVDIAATGLSGDEFEEKLLREAQVWVNSGTMYGTDGFIRINLATQRNRLMEGLRRIAAVFNP